MHFQKHKPWEVLRDAKLGGGDERFARWAELCAAVGCCGQQGEGCRPPSRRPRRGLPRAALGSGAAVSGGAGAAEQGGGRGVGAVVYAEDVGRVAAAALRRLAAPYGRVQAGP